ncbi:hypothetical protein [Salinimicrobium oceani]|uniref:Uncharacterized protein n=1 Tax=Salinimicrobium oceani TaxID=2722702 RepID=A0ABX1D424_9FLAO|nr:hypothetical protein [Salinimicrobium oceani]NJW53938.1 hypothetical protein [Salinimicrobium oceani]
MKKIICLLFCFGITTTFLAQNLESYQYIKVPIKYEFLKQENQYQLNALTAFLFEKKGYQVLFREEIPTGIDPCNVLKADVKSDSGLFRSRLFFTLQNCKNEIVYTSETGVSAEKNFKASYHEALRSAFESFEKNAFDSSIAQVPEKKSPVTTEERAQEVIIDPVVSVKEVEALEETVEEIPTEGEVENVNTTGKTFTNGSINYLLKSTPSGYELFKKGSEKKFASLLKSGGGKNFIYASENISGNAFFDTSGNLVVEYLDANSQQLISVIYKLQP